MRGVLVSWTVGEVWQQGTADRGEGPRAAGRSGSLVAPLLELDGFVHEILLVQDRHAHLAVAVAALELPRGDVQELVVTAQRLAVLRLRLGAEVSAAGLPAVQGVDAHQLAELEEVGDPAGLLEALVERVGRAEHAHVAPELLAQAA